MTMILKGEYLGSPNSKRRKSLKGKTALLDRKCTPGYVRAQFDDVKTGLGYGWHRFPEYHFRIYEL